MNHELNRVNHAIKESFQCLTKQLQVNVRFRFGTVPRETSANESSHAGGWL